jgi:ketosteroid isomerase-like protein
MHKPFQVLFFGLLAIVAVPSLHAQAASTEANKAIVRRAFAAMEQGDLATLNEIFDPDGPWHTPSGKERTNGGPFTDLAGACPMCAALEQRKIVIDLIVAEGDLVSVRSTWSGVYTGTWRGATVRKKPLTRIYSNVYRVSGGRIRENWALADQLSLAEQLGFQLVSPANAK